jgi:hypothetical protein
MVSSVASSPIAFLNQIQGVKTTPVAATQNTSSGSGASTPTTPTVSSNAATNAQSLATSLLNNGNAFTPEVLSLLQQNSSGSFDPVTSLLGGTSTNNALTSLYTNLYDSITNASVTQAQNENTPQATAVVNGAQALINAQTQASVAYNQTNQQNAQAVIDANSYGPNGVTKLIS